VGEIEILQNGLSDAGGCDLQLVLCVCVFSLNLEVAFE
jgi:hypothetical protein